MEVKMDAGGVKKGRQTNLKCFSKLRTENRQRSGDQQTVARITQNKENQNVATQNKEVRQGHTHCTQYPILLWCSQQIWPLGNPISSNHQHSHIISHRTFNLAYLLPFCVFGFPFLSSFVPVLLREVHTQYLVISDVKLCIICSFFQFLSVFLFFDSGLPWILLFCPCGSWTQIWTLAYMFLNFGKKKIFSVPNFSYLLYSLFLCLCLFVTWQHYVIVSF